jgi:hypothetical protein
MCAADGVLPACPGHDDVDGDAFFGETVSSMRQALNTGGDLLPMDAGDESCAEESSW